jgi:predicted Zn-dependent peptidase
MESVSVGLWTDAGSRHEAPSEHGMAHLVEHMLFKGTPTRSAVQIPREIEGLGSSIDGYTVEDHTAYQAKAPAAQFEKLFDVLADFYLRPVMDPADLESEKQVIHEEIAMIQDQPAQLLEDLISEATWGENHPLGRSITGTDASLDAFQRDDLLAFYRRAYCGENTVISVAGNVDPKAIERVVAAQFENLEAGRPASYASAFDPLPEHRFVEAEDQEQTHLALSFEAVHRHDPTRYAVKLLNVILGENMSSRLFQELREERALCYEVQTDLVSFDDAGLLQIFLALSPGNLDEALQSISRILLRIIKEGVTEAELEGAKSYVIGQSRIALENTSSRMMWAGECILFFDELKDPESVHEEVASVTLDQIAEAAQRIFDPLAFSSAVIGPIESDHTLQDWRTTLA